MRRTILAFSCFVLNIVMLGKIFNITPSDSALLPWAIYALLLAYACQARLLLATGLFCILTLCTTGLISWSGLYWLDCIERPEHLLPVGLLILLIPSIISQARHDGFAATYRVMGLLSLFIPVLMFTNWGNYSYLAGLASKWKASIKWLASLARPWPSGSATVTTSRRWCTLAWRYGIPLHQAVRLVVGGHAQVPVLPGTRPHRRADSAGT